MRPRERRPRRRAWARLIRRIYEVDPLVCRSCGGEMRIVCVILEHRVITLTRTSYRSSLRGSEDVVRCGVFAG